MKENHINEILIERGRKLNRLLASDDFAPFKEELESRILEAEQRLLTCVPGYNDPHYINNFLSQRKALKDLRDWIDDEIKAGGRELIRKQDIDLRQSEGTREAVK